LHHGVLLDEQVALLEWLLEHCPNLAAVTYEDARFTEDGELVESAQPNYHRLRDVVNCWASA
jgi:hypothetical protein